MSRIADAFAAVCKENGSRTALIFRSGHTVEQRSFAELAEDVCRMRAYFAAKNLKKGDRILAFAAPSYQLCVCMIAALQTGTPIMYVDIWAKQERLRRIFAEYHPDLVLVSGRTLWLRPFFREIGKIRRVIRVERCSGFAPEKSAAEPLPEDTLALLTMTTGSTGKPKIALRTHSDLLQQLRLIQDNIETQHRETVLTTSYIYVFANILSGFTTVMPKLNLGRSSPAALDRKLKLFRDVPVTMLLTAPDFCLRTEPVFPLLHTVYFGGAILNLHEAEQIRQKYSNCKCITVYGSTECSVIASADLDDYIRTLKQTGKAMLGKPVSGVRVRLSDDGEILISAKALLKHYLSGDLGKETDSSGVLWHHTGDIAEADGDLLFYRGKAGRTVTVCGKQIYSNELEQAISARFPEIPKCAVLQDKNRVNVFLQHPHPDEAGIRRLLAEYGISAPVLRTVKQIPCDVKHHTKIDYETLKEYLK